MTLEERLRRLSEKGELVHLSLAFYDGAYHANLALASPPAGYAKAVNKDPVKALDDVFSAAPVKVRAPKKITATVTEKESPLPNDWTAP